MAETCAKIQELLSAYLDGRLSPEETARVAGHLELCPECAALLEKMRKLDSIAASAVDDIDDDILDELEQRIRADIEALPAVNVEQKSKLMRVTPIWYRYIAAAASIMLVFMIGRAVYTSGSLDEWLPFKKGKTVETGRPPVQGTKPPTPEQVKPLSITPPQPAGAKATDQAITSQARPTEAKQKTISKVSIPAVVPETKTETVTTKEEPKHDEAVQSEDAWIATRDELKDLSRGKEIARTEYQEAGKVIVAPAQTESQTKGEEAGTAAEEGIQKRSSVQTEKSDNTASTRKRLYVPPAMDTESDIGLSIVVQGETRREDTSSAGTQGALSELEKRAGQLKAQAVEELGELGYNNAIVPAGKPSMVHRTTTLQSQYKAVLAYYKPMSGLTSGFAGKPKGGDSTAAVRFVYGRANGMRESSDFDDQTVKLYLTARSGYDLYRLTGEKSYYDRAVSAMDSLMRFLDRYAGDSEKGQTAKAYREELRQLSFQE